VWWRFFDTIDRVVNFAPRGIKVAKIFAYKKQVKRHDFYVKTQFGKTTKRRGRIHYFQKVTVNSVNLYSDYSLFVPSSYLMEVSVYKYPTRCNKSANITNLHNSRICT